jgi:hypothetical protein
MPKWKTSLRMPTRIVGKVASHLHRRRGGIELKYLQLHPESPAEIKVKVIRRVRSVLVVAESKGEISINILSDAIMECLPDDCCGVQVPYWS